MSIPLIRTLFYVSFCSKPHGNYHCVRRKALNSPKFTALSFIHSFEAFSFCSCVCILFALWSICCRLLLSPGVLSVVVFFQCYKAHCLCVCTLQRQQPVNSNAYIKCGSRLRYVISFIFNVSISHFRFLTVIFVFSHFSLVRSCCFAQSFSANNDDNLNISIENGFAV